MSSHRNSKVSDRLFWAKGDKKLYDELEEQEKFFKNKGRKEQFMFALAVGFHNGNRQPLNTYDGMFNSRDLTPMDISIIESIAVQTEGNVSVIEDEAKIYRVAEEYAHGGIKILNKEVKNVQFGSYPKKLEISLTELISQKME